ncbi:MAG: MATE family efflux transporter [Rhodospirillales bacterium]
MKRPSDLALHVRETVKLAIPVMLARAGFIIMVTVDTIMTGQVSAQMLAHYGISMAPHITVLVIGIGLMAATTILSAQAKGARRERDIGAIWRNALVIAALLGLLTGSLLSYGEEILLLLGQSNELAVAGGAAVRAFAWGLPGLFLFLACAFFLEGIGRPQIGMVITLSGNLVNAGVNWLLIEGHWGFPAMGAAGAAMGTTVTRWVMFAAILFYLLVLMRDRDAFGLLGRSLPLKVAVKQLKLGLPLALSVGLQTAALAALATFAGWLGDRDLAAFQIANNVVAFLFMLSIGMANATSVRVANAVGRGDQTARVTAGLVGLGLILCLQVILAAAIEIFPSLLARVYTTEAAVLALAVPAFFWVGLTVVADGSQAVLQGALRAMGQVWVPLAIYFASYWLFMVPLGYLLAYRWGWGVEGLLAALFLGYALAAVAMAFRFRITALREVKPL